MAQWLYPGGLMFVIASLRAESMKEAGYESKEKEDLHSCANRTL